VSNGPRFVSEAQKVTRQKAIVALKVGRYPSGQRAAASHSGALAGQENAFNAAFHKAGVIRADTTEELFDWARALAWCPLPKGRKIAILTSAGGPGVTAADALEMNGMSLAQLAQDTHSKLRVGLACAVANAVAEVKACAHYVAEKQGGQGAVREIIEMILKAQEKWQDVVALYKNAQPAALKQ
jgi:acetyltransferase